MDSTADRVLVPGSLHVRVEAGVTRHALAEAMRAAGMIAPLTSAQVDSWHRDGFPAWVQVVVDRARARSAARREGGLREAEDWREVEQRRRDVAWAKVSCWMEDGGKGVRPKGEYAEEAAAQMALYAIKDQLTYAKATLGERALCKWMGVELP